MKPKNLLVLAIGVLALAAGVFTQRAVDGAGQPSTIVGRSRIDFTLNDTAGASRRLSEWDGKVVMVNFWATWCPPCLEEIPGFVKLQAEYAARGLQIVGVAVDNPDDVRKFVRAHGINYPVLVGDEDGALSRRYGNNLDALPYTVIIDRHGKVIEARRGMFPRSEAEAAIRGLL